MKEPKHTAGPLIWLHHHRHGIDVAVLGPDIEPTTHFDVSQDREDEYLEDYSLPEPFASAPSLLTENARLREALSAFEAAASDSIRIYGILTATSATCDALILARAALAEGGAK